MQFTLECGIQVLVHVAFIIGSRCLCACSQDWQLFTHRWHEQSYRHVGRQGIILQKGVCSCKGPALVCFLHFWLCTRLLNHQLRSCCLHVSLIRCLKNYHFPPRLLKWWFCSEWISKLLAMGVVQKDWKLVHFQIQGWNCFCSLFEIYLGTMPSFSDNCLLCFVRCKRLLDIGRHLKVKL